MDIGFIQYQEQISYTMVWDIGAPEGTKVMAGLTGTVTTSAYNDSYGNYVVIKDSKGYELRYAHLSSRSVSAGVSVTKGDEIGLVGNTGNSTGSHLHIELLKKWRALKPDLLSGNRRRDRLWW